MCNKHYRRFQRTGDPLGSVPRSKKHGLTGYDYHGCRCDVCKAAKSQSYRELRERLTGSPNTPHGTKNGYDTYGCRCESCHEAMHAYQASPAVRARRAQLAAARRAENQGRQEGFTHGPGGYGNYGCGCDICLDAAREASRRRVAKDLEEQGAAERSGDLWTGADLEIVLTRANALDDRQIARLLGRSVKAVRMARYKSTHDPKWMKAAGVDDA